MYHAYVIRAAATLPSCNSCEMQHKYWKVTNLLAKFKTPILDKILNIFFFLKKNSDVGSCLSENWEKIQLIKKVTFLKHPI
jgi:hypothetical protein